MIADVGKIPASTILQDSSVMTFFNGVIKQSSVTYNNVNGFARYNVIGNSSDVSNKHRALYFMRSYPGTSFGATIPMPVIYVPPDVDQNSSDAAVTSQFLYECIAPQICCSDKGIYQLLFWTNTDDASKLQKDNSGDIIYNQDAVTKFKSDYLGDISSVSTSVRLLCSANIDFEMLTSSLGGTLQLTPVLKKIIVLTTVSNENYATDFAGGGSGGGLKIHTHVDNNSGGFAFATFAPSAIISPISWK